MQKLAPKPPIDSRRFAANIVRQPEFAGASADKEHRTRAIAASALALAEREEKAHGEYDADANLYKMIGQLSTFYESQKKLDSLRDRFGSVRYMPSNVRDTFRKSKEEVIKFNHTLHEVINACASRMSFDQLIDFMTDIHRANGGSDTVEDFRDQARWAVIGMRNEMAYEQILILADIDYKLGDIAEDSTGKDFEVDGVAIDVKASERQAQAAREKAIREGRDPRLILWSRINFKDFNGRLTLSYEKALELAAPVKADLAEATASRAPYPRRGQ